MEADKHLTFVFIFALAVIAFLIGEVNHQALAQRSTKDVPQSQSQPKAP